jgi:hypothetical protein
MAALALDVGQAEQRRGDHQVGDASVCQTVDWFKHEAHEDHLAGDRTEMTIIAAATQPQTVDNAVNDADPAGADCRSVGRC